MIVTTAPPPAAGPVVLGFGVYNPSISVAQQYGLIGLGTQQPQNVYGLAAQGGATSALAQSSERFGLPFRTYRLTVKFGI